MVTIIIPISRDDYLTELFESLENLECDIEETNILTYVDGDQRLFEKARNFTIRSKFKQRLCLYRKKGLANVGSIHRRRQRIADIHNELKQYLSPPSSKDFVFLIEDDTLIPPETLKFLLEDYSRNYGAGFISGMELGRWGYVHIGVWTVDDVDNPNQITSLANSLTGLEKIDAAGLYCCLVRAKTYISHTFKPFENILGLDVDFGLTLRQKKFYNLVDRRIKCKHLNKKHPVDFNEKIIQVQFNRMVDHKFGWEMKVLP